MLHILPVPQFAPVSIILAMLHILPVPQFAPVSIIPAMFHILPVPQFAPVSIIPAILHIHSFILIIDIIRRTNEQSLGTFKESNAFSNIRGALDRKVIVWFVQASEGELYGCKTHNFNVFYIKINCFSYRQSVLWGQ